MVGIFSAHRNHEKPDAHDQERPEPIVGSERFCDGTQQDAPKCAQQVDWPVQGFRRPHDNDRLRGSGQDRRRGEHEREPVAPCPDTTHQSQIGIIRIENGPDRPESATKATWLARENRPAGGAVAAINGMADAMIH